MNAGTTKTLTEPGKFAGLTLRNRVALAPMTRISGEADGRANDLMLRYYRGYAEGGFGLLITEGLYTDILASQGYINQPGIATQAQADSWKPVVEAVHRVGGRFIAQLMHAGALAQHNSFGHAPLAPSAIQPKGEQMGFYHGEGPYALPKAAGPEDLDAVVQGFVQSARNAVDAGFDGVEIHGANGYLLDQFLTDYTNARDDQFGGDSEARIGFMCRVIESVRRAVSDETIVGVRISQGKVNDFEHKWANGLSDAEIVFSALADAGADYIHTTEFEAFKPAFGDDGESLAVLAKRISSLEVIANGSLGDPATAGEMLDEGIDLVALGRAALGARDWPNRVAQGESIPDFNPEILSPSAEIKM